MWLDYFGPILESPKNGNIFDFSTLLMVWQTRVVFYLLACSIKARSSGVSSEACEPNREGVRARH